MATTALTLDDFPLIGATPAGGRAKLTGLDGWIRRTSRRERSDRTGMPGSWSTPGLDASKAIDVTALIFYADPASAAAEREVIAALGSAGEVAMVVTDANGTRRRMVDLDDVDPVVLSAQWLRVEVTAVANTPYAIDPTPTTTPLPASSTVTVTSPGTAAADLLVTVTSAGTVVLTAGGATLTTTALPVGAVVTCGPGFDSSRRTVRTSGGTPLLGVVLPGSQWPSLPAGGGPVTQAGTAALSVEHFDTYA